MNSVELDVLIFGGGIAGLWLLDELHRRGYCALLLESHALGSGQTIASQGILHGGLKYSLSGLVDGSSKAVAAMPGVWDASLNGQAPPDLRGVRVLSPCCHMWRTDSLASRAGLLAALVVVRTAIDKVSSADRPAALRECPGDVLRVEEKVLEAHSLLDVFRRAHADRILMMLKGGAEFVAQGDGTHHVRVTSPATNEKIEFRPRVTILCAGEGNADLHRRVGLDGAIMQTRPLHMVIVRGKLPPLFGHCVDGNKTRATITTAIDSAGRSVWIVGGEIAETGVDRSEAAQVEFAQRELRHVLPGVDFQGTQWATYRINRAEGRTPGNRRPDGTVWRKEGSIITAWPTKLVLAPQLAREIADSLAPPIARQSELPLPDNWPRPSVAVPPWELIQTWMP